MDREEELVEGALTPCDYVLGSLDHTFPIHAQKLVEIAGNMVAEPLRDETVALVVSRAALALRDTAMMVLPPISRKRAVKVAYIFIVYIHKLSALLIQGGGSIDGSITNGQ